jgi:DNA-directed RNA polymerase subunit RPC12/RpoP
MKIYECRDCKTEYEWSTGQPGRPPVRCADCREKVQQRKVAKVAEVETRLRGKARAERLELMLKAQGVHPSQHLDKFE